MDFTASKGSANEWCLNNGEGIIEDYFVSGKLVEFPVFESSIFDSMIKKTVDGNPHFTDEAT